MVNDNMTVEITKQDDNSTVFYGALTDTCGRSPMQLRFKVEAEEEDGSWVILSIETLDPMCREQVDYLASKEAAEIMSEDMENIVWKKRVRQAFANQTK
jgi:hypothetical protein